MRTMEKLFIFVLFLCDLCENDQLSDLGWLKIIAFPPTHLIVSQLQWFGLQMGVLSAEHMHAPPLHIKFCISHLFTINVSFSLSCHVHCTVPNSSGTKAPQIKKKKKRIQPFFLSYVKLCLSALRSGLQVKTDHRSVLKECNSFLGRCVPRMAASLEVLWGETVIFVSAQVLNTHSGATCWARVCVCMSKCLLRVCGWMPRGY